VRERRGLEADRIGEIAPVIMNGESPRAVSMGLMGLSLVAALMNPTLAPWGKGRMRNWTGREVPITCLSTGSPRSEGNSC
jgi:hypothetical protein